MSDDRFRQLRAVLWNAAMWAAAWALAGGAITATLTLFNPGPGVDSLVERLGLALLAGISWGVRFGIAGGVIGTAFAAIIRIGYRGRRLADINPLRFTLLGAVIGGVGVPLFLQTMNVLTGGSMIAWGLVTDDAVWATVFGAVVAAGSILLARRADALVHGPRPDQLEHDDNLGALPATEPREIARSEHSRAARSCAEPRRPPRVRDAVCTGKHENAKARPGDMPRLQN